MPEFRDNFQHDIFISYAPLDNETDDGNTGWVQVFSRKLELAVKRRTGNENIDLYYDLLIPGHKDKIEEQKRALQTSALFVLIISESYLRTDNCIQELKLFINECNHDRINQRIHIVNIDNVSRHRWPEELQSFQDIIFYDTSGTVPYTLGRPETKDKDNIFNSRIVSLAHAISQELSIIEGEVSIDRSRPTVFLAETSSDISEIRDKVKSYLYQNEIQVIPNAFYDRSINNFQRSMKQDIVQARSEKSNSFICSITWS